MATHNPEIVLREAEQVICLDRGTVAFAGSVQELYYSPPTRDVARFLGPINWIPRDESLRWTGLPSTADIISRPEQIRIEPAAESPLVVRQAQFSGAIEEVRIDDLETHGTRRFFHRPARPLLSSGMHVAIRVLALLLLCVGMSGCLNASAHSRPLSAKSTRSWNLPAVKSTLPAPRGVHAATSGELYVLDNAGRVLVYDRDRKFSRSWFMPEYSVGKPERLCLLRDGRIAVADTHYHRIVFFDPQGKVLQMIGKYGSGPGEFVYPVALDEDEAGNIYVCEYGGNDRVQKFDKQGKFLLEFGRFGTGEGEFQRPSGIVCRNGTLYIVDAFNNRVQMYDELGKYLGLLGRGDRLAELNYPYDLAINPAGELFIVEYGGNCVTRLSPQGELLGRFGLTGSNVEPFSTPWGITLDQSGRIYVADTGNRRVTELSP
ncbi:MAG: 6-bladed beta-propeller [Planctomycetales bacterium]